MKSSLSLTLEEQVQAACPAPSLCEKALRKGADYLLLIKLRLSALALFTAAIGYLMATKGGVNFKHFAVTMLGAFAVIAAACAFNQVMERDRDAQMRRTANRPLPTMRMSVMEAGLAAAVMSLGGLLLLSISANLLAAALALTALVLYLAAYTPLKPISPLCNFFGAVAGAMPPLIGWAAVRGSIHAEGWALFALQFLWQFPHLWSIAWVYHTDYARAGFRIMPELDGHIPSAARKIVAVSAMMLLISLVPLWRGSASLVGATGVALLGLMVVKQSVDLWRRQSNAAARQLMLGAMLYLPAVMTMMLLDKMMLMK
ncbi:MAG: heme o synthase [Abditibacteriales bacterium]|nr:heme o synthase [Abditibacteriales bacterium]MDW8366642.1 heme o synthase [Abditibacteriales bacterium]